MAAWFYGFSTLIFWSAFKSLIELNPEKHLFEHWVHVGSIATQLAPVNDRKE